VVVAFSLLVYPQNNQKTTKNTPHSDFRITGVLYSKFDYN